MSVTITFIHLTDLTHLFVWFKHILLYIPILGSAVYFPLFYFHAEVAYANVPTTSYELPDGQ
jgi:hypothetical protein